MNTIAAGAASMSRDDLRTMIGAQALEIYEAIVMNYSDDDVGHAMIQLALLTSELAKRAVRAEQ